MAKQQSMSNIDKMLAENLKKESKVLPGIRQDDTLIAKGNTDSFDYIEKWTGEKNTLSTPVDVVNQNYIAAQYNEGKKNSQDQGFWGELAGFAAQTVAGEIVLGTLSGVGYLLDVQHWGSQLMGGEGDWGNWFSDYMESGKEWIREAAPIYEDPDNVNRGAWENALHGDGWWASNGVSVASSLSILIPVAGWSRGVSLLGKVGKMGANAARVGKLGTTTAKATKTVDKVMDLFPPMGEGTKLAIDGVHKATVSRLIESQMEATQVFKEKYDHYMENYVATGAMTEQEAKQAAGEAASFTYNANWAALAMDIPQYMLLGGAGHRLKSMLHKKKPGWIQNSNLLNRTKKLRSLGFQGITEGMEEAYQFIVAEEGKYMGDIQAGIIEEGETTFGERFQEYWDDSEMWTSAFFGALGGGVFAGLGPGATGLINKAFRKGEEQLSLKDLRLKEEESRFARLSQNIDLMDKAVESQDEEAIFQAKANLAFEMAKDASAVNNWDKARSSMAQLKNATAEEREAYGIDEDFIENIDEWIKHMDKAADIYSRAKVKYTYGLADMVAKRQFNKYIYQEQAPAIQSKIDTARRESIPNVDKLSKDGNTVLDMKMEVAGMKRAVEILEQRSKNENLSEMERALLKEQAERGKAFVEQKEQSLNELLEGKDDIYNEYDKQAWESIESGSGEDLVTLSAKQKVMEAVNFKNQKELDFWSSRAGVRKFKEMRAAKHKADKEARDAAKRQEKQAKDAREAAGMPSPSDDAPGGVSDEVKNLNIKEVYEAIQNGKPLKEFVNTEEDRAYLSHKLAEYEDYINENPETGKEEIEEDMYAADDTGGLTFNAPVEEAEVADESEITPDENVQENLDTVLKSEVGTVIEVPDNVLDDVSWRAGDMLEEDSSLAARDNQLGWLSTNNPIASRTEDQTPEKKALSAFLEDPGTIITDYQVKFEIGTEFMETQGGEVYEALQKKINAGEMPSDREIGQLPINAVIYTKDGKPAERDGHQLKMAMHDPGFFWKTENGVKVPKYPAVSSFLAKQAILHKRAVTKLILEGQEVFAPLTDKSDGKLINQRENGGEFAKQYVAQTLHKSIDTIPFYVGASNGKFVDHNKRIKFGMLKTAKPGAIYTEVKTANGRRMPVRLQVNNLSREEAAVIHGIYVDLLSSPSLINAPLNENIKDYITDSKAPILKDMLTYLDLDKMTYQDLLSHLVYEGSRTKASNEGRLLHNVNVTHQGKALPNIVHFGDFKMPLERLESEKGREEFIQWLMSNKRRQIDLTRLGDKAYKRYINGTQIISTNIKTTPEGHAFIQPLVTYGSGMRTEQGSEVTPKPKKRKRGAPSKEVEATLTKSEFDHFVDTGEVSDSRLNKIVDKLISEDKLTPGEEAIATDKMLEVNTLMQNRRQEELNAIAKTSGKTELDKAIEATGLVSEIHFSRNPQEGMTTQKGEIVLQDDRQSIDYALGFAKPVFPESKQIEGKQPKSRMQKFGEFIGAIPTDEQRQTMEDIGKEVSKEIMVDKLIETGDFLEFLDGYITHVRERGTTHLDQKHKLQVLDLDTLNLLRQAAIDNNIEVPEVSELYKYMIDKVHTEELEQLEANNPKEIVRRKKAFIDAYISDALNKGKDVVVEEDITDAELEKWVDKKLANAEPALKEYYKDTSFANYTARAYRNLESQSSNAAEYALFRWFKDFDYAQHEADVTALKTAQAMEIKDKVSKIKMVEDLIKQSMAENEQQIDAGVQEKMKAIEGGSTIKETVKMFQENIKTEDGKEIKVNLPEEDDFDDNPC
jgi:hypothetical protein